MRESRWWDRGIRVRVAVTDPVVLPAARHRVTAELATLARTCGAHWGGTELSRLHRAAGVPVRVSPLLADLVRTALAAAELTGGDVDPTVGAALVRLHRTGYRSWLPVCGSSTSSAGHPDGWRQVALRDGWLTVPVTALLDLGATASAYAAHTRAPAAHPRTRPQVWKGPFLYKKR
jgi:thiamine biosynthesis lipoprotein